MLVPDIALCDFPDDRLPLGGTNGLLAEVPEAPFVDVDRKTETRNECASRDGLGVPWPIGIQAGPFEERSQYLGRYALRRLGIDVGKHYQLGQQQRPMRAGLGDEALPIEGLPTAQEQVRDIGHILPMPLADEEPVPDQLLRGSNPNRLGGEYRGTAVAIPISVDHRQAIPHPEDQVDEMVAQNRLCQPLDLLQPRAEPRTTQCPHRFRNLFRFHEEVQVLRFPVDARVLVDCVGTSDDEGDAASVERLDRPLVRLPFLLGDPEVAMRHRRPFLSCQVVGSRESGSHGNVSRMQEKRKRLSGARFGPIHPTIDVTRTDPLLRLPNHMASVATCRYLPPMLNEIRRLFRKSVEAFRLELDSREPQDQVAELLSAMRRELVAARAAIQEFEAAVQRARADLERERKDLELCERRGSMASRIGDEETVRIAEEFAGKHRQRIVVLEQKVTASEAELDLRRNEADEMKRRYQQADANRFVLLSQLRRAAVKENMRSRLSEEEGPMSDFSRMEEKIRQNAGYADAMEELGGLDSSGPPPPPQPSAEELNARLEELKRRMGRK
ncbi:MAG: hypothetical protein GEU90_19700 [Gemmatimonas sp.]|nr:hypothetical protein [Gemmatimonas sp.]